MQVLAVQYHYRSNLFLNVEKPKVFFQTNGNQLAYVKE